MHGCTTPTALKTLAAFAMAALVAGCGHGGGAGSAVPRPMQPQAQSRAAQERLNAVPGERLNALPGLPTTGTMGERLNALPGQPQQLCTPASALHHVTCPVEKLSYSPQTDPNTPYAQILGFKAHDIKHAYQLPWRWGTGHTVAVVDAFDDPVVESDLAVYRSTMGFAPCTTDNGCFKKVIAHNGNSTKADAGWSAEIALDVEMVSAVCPNCNIVLVEAKSDKMKDLAAAEDVAASYAPDAISNSWYAPEDASETNYTNDFSHPGIAITAAAGDNGFGAAFPAALPGVIAVGGTTLLPDDSVRGWSEAVWGGSGSGCSIFMPKPAWQDDPGCTGRSIADVSVVGDPRTGVAMYTSVAAPGQPTGWIVAGGTSVGAPIVAAMYALAGNVATINPPRRLWLMRSALWPVYPASNGACPSSAAYLCGGSTTAAGYSGPAGNGTPNGLFAF